MDEGAILIAGVGGIGCIWAERSHSRCQDMSDLLLIDADENSFAGAPTAHCLHLDAGGDGRGTAALPALAAHRLRDGLNSINPLLEQAEPSQKITSPSPAEGAVQAMSHDLSSVFEPALV